MFTRASSLALLLALAAAVALAADSIVKRSVDAREGPGAYYPLTFRVLSGTRVEVLEQADGWRQVAVTDRRGWIPEPALDAVGRKGAEKDLIGGLERRKDRGEGAGIVSKVQVSAAVRSFAKRYGEGKREDRFVDRSAELDTAPDAAGYQEFLAARFVGRDRQKLRARFRIEPGDAPPRDADADAIGLALSNVVAQRGLRRDAALERYLGNVAQLVADSSHAYDVPARVFVLDTPALQGYATPGGILFISAGLLRAMKSEAEFAFFAGHQLAHVAFRHGFKERMPELHRARDDAFAELDSQLNWEQGDDKRYADVARKLDEIADSLLNYMRKEDDADLEAKADSWGMIYAYRAGYAPADAPALLERLAGTPASVTEGWWQAVPLADRAQRCRSTLRKLANAPNEEQRFPAEFLAAIGGLPQPDRPQ